MKAIIISAILLVLIALTFSFISCSADVPEEKLNEDILQGSATSSKAFIINGRTLKGLTEYGQTLEKIEIPDNITSIGSEAFRNCENLRSVTIPDGVSRISEAAFSGCRSLTNIEIGKSVWYIDRCAFCKCSSLSEITIPDGVESIDSLAFFACPKLSSVTIGAGVTNISSDAFWRCNSLRNISVNQTDNQLLADTEIPTGCSIYI
ncbi:MAG: leucine-rich repeat domain-containing protein [Bullifex sp.]